MGAEQSKENDNEKYWGALASTKRDRTPLVNVHDFVIKNINGAFIALKHQKFMDSNCYSLLYTLIRGTITSDDLRATGLVVLPYAFEGVTQLSDRFPQIYYYMLQNILNQTSNLNISELFQKKQNWIRNPSEVVNTILRRIGARRIIAQDTPTQANALSQVCKDITSSAKSAGGAGRECSMHVLFNGATIQQQNRCCICGLDQPPPLTDIEHVVSSQLLILLGLCPGTKSWAGFRQIFNELNNIGDDNKNPNWVGTIINYFPDKKQQLKARVAFRSMMLPAHAHCNQTIKREWSPFYVDAKGNIQANIREPFTDMGDKTYVEKVIEPSIDYVNNTRNQKGVPKKLNREELSVYTEDWITKQQSTFNELAWLLNSIDQRNNRASWFLIDYLYRTANETGNDSDKAAFVELVADILGLEKGANWSDMERVLGVKDNQFKIATTLTLVVEAVLVLFQSDVQTPIQAAIDENSGSDADIEYSQSLNSTRDTTSVSSYASESELGSIDYKNSSSSDDESQDNSQPTSTGTSSIISNELQNPTGNASNQQAPTQVQVLDRYGRSLKRARLNNPQIIEIAARNAVSDYYGDYDTTEQNKNNSRSRAINAASIALNNTTDDTNLYDVAYNAAMVALRQYNDGNISPGLGGGLRNRTTCKYTTRGRRSTRKCRPSKKPRRTIRRQRRNKKGTQKRRK